MRIVDVAREQAAGSGESDLRRLRRQFSTLKNTFLHYDVKEAFLIGAPHRRKAVQSPLTPYVVQLQAPCIPLPEAAALLLSTECIRWASNPPGGRKSWPEML